ncbi:MAG: methyltransferase [Candidatus Competibacteraceae bacterium]|nr:methyltransferase [Candidatus Competibacteraceae bacterium]
MSLQKNTGAVRRFSALMKFAGWLQNIPNKVTPPPFRLMQIGSAFWQSRVLYVAVKLNIADILGDERLAVDMIAARASAQPDAIYRLLRMLAAMGVFAEVSPRVFANNRLSSPLRADKADSVRAMILMHNSDEMSRPWYEQLEKSVRQGGVPFAVAHGSELYDYMDDHAEFDTLFSQAMDSVESLSGDSFARDFDWGAFERVIDIGGSKGSKSLAILERHSRVKALVVDRSQVIQDAERHWAGRESPALLSRMSFQVGDLFGAVPTARSDKDIYLLSGVLHGFDDDACVKALLNLARACDGTGARVAIMEQVMNESGADFAGSAFDMQMFMGTRGRERTLVEWSRLFDMGGFTLEEQVNLQSFVKILVLKAK